MYGIVCVYTQCMYLQVSPTSDVGDTLGNAHYEALNAVSYLGCVVSILSLLLTIIFLLIFRYIYEGSF